MSKYENVKKIVNAVVGISVTSTVGSIINNQLAPQNTIQKIEVGVASLTVGAMVADHTRAWTDKQIDELFTAFHNKPTR